jgi:predicted outer membrane repeat protein
VISDNTSDGTNWPDGLGGGVYVRDGSVKFRWGQVVSNTASYKGGGVCVWNGKVTLNDVQIIGNHVNGPTFWDGGGGVWVLGSANFSGGQIISNTAVFGGGLYVYLSDVTASGLQITGNSTPGGSGGGVLVWPVGRMTLNGGEISNNSAAGTGGGLLIWSGASVTLNRVEISNNAADSGGGVYSGGTLTLTNSVVSDNRANVGSGLYVEGDSSRLLHTTLVRNLGGEGSGIHVAGSAIVTMTNTIIASHTLGITVTGGSTATLESTLWHDNTTDWGGEGTINHSLDYAGDPAFNAPGAGDYHIGSGSAAIDAGVDAGVTDDIDGDIRPFDGDADGIDGFDIGADEYVKWHVYLPLVLKNP